MLAPRPDNHGVRGASPFCWRPGMTRAQLLFNVLDSESRRRALTDEESRALQGAMRTMGLL